MTECNRQSFSFSSLKRRRIVADFAGGTLTSDAGGLLLREVDRQCGLTAALAACLTDPRDPAKITHDLRTMLAQRVRGIALGYEDLNDHATLRSDPLFAVLAERPPSADSPLASPPTLCRFENTITRKSLSRMSAVFVEQFIAWFSQPPKEIILDFDATDDPVHGNQEGRFFHGYYDHYCFLPLYVFCGDHLLCSCLRPSNLDVALHSRAILKLLVTRIRQTWPKVRIIVRADSGFCRWKLMRWCDRHGVFYVPGLARNSRAEAIAARFMAAAEKRYRRTHAKQRTFHDIRYAAESWDRKRRVIVKAEYLEQGANVRFVVTNLPKDRAGVVPGYSPADVYDGIYVARGDMENRIKEQQLGLFADRTSCHAFAANQFRLLLASAAYLLVSRLRREHLANTELAAAQADTIRLKLFKVAARVVVSVRRIVLHLSTSYPLQTLFRKVASQLTTYPTAASISFAPT